MRAKASIWIARRWPTGWAQSSRLLEPLVEALRRYVLAATSCMPTTRRFRCWLRATARRRPGGCGPMFAMIVRRAVTAAPAVWFAYSPDRKGEHPQQHLQQLPRHPASRCLRRLQPDL